MLAFFTLLAWLSSLSLLSLAVPLSPATTDLTPWTSLGISLDDAARFESSGTTPQEGIQIINTEMALFNGTPSHLVPGAISAATGMGMASTSDGLNPKLVIVVGWRAQHAGVTWRKEGISSTYDLAFNYLFAVDQMCPNNPSSDGKSPCNYLPKQQLHDIYYNVGKNAYIDVAVRNANYPNKVHEEMIRTQWAVFKELTECDVNRYQLRNWALTECREFANVADQIDVKIENWRGPDNKLGVYEQPSLRIGLQFNGKTAEGRFDCVGSQTVIWDKVRSHMIPRWEKLLKTKVDFDVVCVSERVDGECKNNVICNDDNQWNGAAGAQGGCAYHDKCANPRNCDYSLNY